MTRIIDIDAMMPGDVTVRWRQQEWLLPGDLSVEHVLTIQRAAQALEDSTKSGNEPGVRAAFEALGGAIADVLAIKQPDRVQDLTFGTRELGLLAGAIIQAVSGQATPAQGDAEGNGAAAAGK